MADKTAVQEAPVETTEKVTDPALEIYAPVFQTLKTVTEKANDLAVKVRTATSGKDEALAVILNTSDDATIVDYRAKAEKAKEAIAKINAQMAEITDAVKTHAQTLLPGVTDGFDAAKGREEFMSLRRDATNMRGTIALLLGGDEAKVKSAYDYFGISEVVGLTRNSTVNGPAGKKPRISAATIDGQPFADSSGKVTFTLLASHLGADVNDLRTAYFKAAGTEDTKEIAGKDISFNFTVKDSTKALVLTASEGNAPKAETPAAETEEAAEESAA